MQHGMFTSRAVTVAYNRHSTGMFCYNQIRKNHPTIAVNVTNIKLYLVESFIQRLKIAKGVRFFIWQLDNCNATLIGFVDLLQIARPAHEHGDRMPMSNQLD